MASTINKLRLGGRDFVIVPVSEYRRLERLAKQVDADAVSFAKASIGRDLARRRRAAGLSQAVLATRAKIRAETLSRLENGRGNPTLATVRSILRALGDRA